MATANASATSGGVAAVIEASPPAAGTVGGVGGSAAAAAASSSSGAAEDAAAKSVQKRYEGLVVVRSKAIKGKGAWYWTHLEPMLVPNPDTGLPKAVKLRCSLCDAVFSASNPSRTASEHLKRGTCPNFSSSPSSAAAGGGGAHTPPLPRPISTIHPCPSSPSPHQHRHHQQQTRHPNRKRQQPAPPSSSPTYHQISPLAIVEASRFSSPTATDIVHSSSATPPAPHLHHLQQAPQQHQQPHLVTAGGKEDLGALALLEDSVKRLKSPKASPGPALSKSQVESAVSLLSDWVYESCGAVSFSSVEHPKFRAFLHQVGLPPVSRRELAGARLDARYEEVRSESEDRIRDALFFQVASDGWKARGYPGSKEEGLVNLTVNLLNGTSVFRKAVFTTGKVPPKYAEEILWDTVAGICNSSGGEVQRCVGIVADRFKATALRDLENRNHWMVNLPCQLQGFYSLIKDFARDLPLFRTVVARCAKLAHFFNTNSQARGVFHKYQLQEHDHASLLRVTPAASTSGAADSWDGGGRVAIHRTGADAARNLAAVVAMLEDVLGFGHALQMAVLDDSYKLTCVDDPAARDAGDMIHDESFWNDLGSVLSLVKVVRSMAQDMEAERPLVGQCLPLWEELRAKVKDWCAKFNVDHGPVEKVVERRFKKNYHPAWSAAFILDPLYLARDTSGKYLPQFKWLTPEQEKDVDKLITRLVSREEAHIALMELMKWRTEGMDPLYAQAVQVKQRDPVTGKMRIANPLSRRLVWETRLSEFRSLGKVAIRLIFLHATAGGFKSNWSLLRWVYTHGRSRAGMDRAQKLVFLAAHAKLERRDFSNEEEKDAELFANGEDDMLNEVFADVSSV
ncbi:hypothetical protein Taro_031813 [Colocasia esculenta]|uniref:DUF7963 domain-containing protein n=1 Tax=Colocasia esculenta TaxID=4460 RepID=A0A843W495_COLES|nr:hypothetical protein [Colocasia esculenta]